MGQVIADVDVLFKPDVGRFGLLDWKSFDLIVEQGYRHAQEVLANPVQRPRLFGQIRTRELRNSARICKVSNNGHVPLTR